VDVPRSLDEARAHDDLGDRKRDGCIGDEAEPAPQRMHAEETAQSEDDDTQPGEDGHEGAHAGVDVPVGEEAGLGHAEVTHQRCRGRRAPGELPRHRGDVRARTLLASLFAVSRRPPWSAVMDVAAPSGTDARRRRSPPPARRP